MKKIIASLLVVAAVSASMVYGTRAYFSDTEVSEGNTFTTGTIDIAVDGQNPWERTEPYALVDMKPSYTDYIDFEIQNVGSNPTVVWKRIDVTDQSTGTVTEPECTDQGGSWNGASCDWGGNTDNNDLASYIHYDMTVGGEELIPEDWDYMVDDVDGVWVPLGVIQPQEVLTVSQSYHLDGDVENWAQGDEMMFDITLYAEQRMGDGPEHTLSAVVLENKTGDPDWYPVVDGTWGYVGWDGSGNYTLNAYGLDTSVTYRLAYFDEVTEVETGISAYVSPNADGTLTISGTYAGFNTNTDAKYWLRPNDWDNAKTLWESNLVN